jgi:cytochrome c oxidase assembly protein subunit 11
MKVTERNGKDGREATLARRRRTTVLTCAAIVLSMTGLSFAAVPLYRLYCQVTGYSGTTQRADKASSVVLDRALTVHFDANVAADLPWRFEPQQQKLEVKIGENALAFYKATNRSDRPVTGTAVFNVTPEAAGIHFNKVQCFCFTEQRLEPGESVDMAVSFYVDPDFATDENTRRLSELTLSYTFYAAGESQGKLGQTAANATGGGR